MAEKALVSKADLKKLRELTGSRAVAPKLPQIKVSYDKDKAPRGEFYKTVWNPETEENEVTKLGPSFEGIILVHTKKCSKWDGTNEKMEYYSNEFDSYDEDVWLCRDGEFVHKDIYRNLKRDYGVRLQLVLYIYLPDEERVYKMFVGGSGIFPFGDYDKATGMKLPLLTTEFSTTVEKKGSTEYYPLAFNKTDETQDFSGRIALAKLAREAIVAQNDAFKESHSSDYEAFEDGVTIQDIELPKYDENSTLLPKNKKSSDKKKELSDDDLPDDTPF